MDFYNPSKGLSTYDTGIIQAKAYRALRIAMTKALKSHGLSMTEWALLGTIYDKKFVRYSELAEILQVKPPLITKIVDILIDKELVTSTKDKDDKRSKLLTVTKKSQKSVPLIEIDVKNKMKDLVKEITHQEILVYIKVLHTISKNLESVK